MNIDFLLIPEEQRYRMDIHSYTLEEAIITIQNTLDILEYGIRVIVVIHGYSTGSILLKGIRNDLKHNRIEKIVPSLNPGVTLIYLKENYTIPLRKIKRKKYKKKKKKRKLWKYTKIMLYYICKLIILKFYLIIVVEEGKDDPKWETRKKK